MAGREPRILWSAMLAALLAYVAAAHLLQLPVASDAPPSLLIPFAGLALASGAASLVLRRVALAAPIAAGTLDPASPRALAPFVAGLALAESVGVFGLVLALLAGEPVWSLVFCAAAAFLLYRHRPDAPDLAPPLGHRSRGDDPRPIG